MASANRPVDEGFDEAHMTKLPNGDIFCVMRTGSYSPMWQARSRDGGRTWDTPRADGLAWGQAAIASAAE